VVGGGRGSIILLTFCVSFYLLMQCVRPEKHCEMLKKNARGGGGSGVQCERQCERDCERECSVAGERPTSLVGEERCPVAVAAPAAIAGPVAVVASLQQRLQHRISTDSGGSSPAAGGTPPAPPHTRR
jgi:hypothetical protein